MALIAMIGRRALPFLVTAVFAAVWGLLGRFLLDWLLGRLGFNTTAQPPMLTFAFGSPIVWSLVAVALWTPLTDPLRRSTRRRAAWLGTVVACAGVVVLYGLFVLSMGGLSSAQEFLASLAFFPLFVVSAVAFGGFVAIPVTIVTALLLRQLLQGLPPLMSGPNAA